MKVLSTAVVLLVVFSVIVLGCARAGGDPISPTNGLSVTGATASAENADVHDNHVLYGQWTLFINEDHTSVDVVPMRQARLHLNALKFLESYCTDCVQVTKIENNGDSTIDMTVKITHPFAGHPEYTGFDVKGIIMFNGSHVLFFHSADFYPLNDPLIISWRELGDPDVLNPDGYTPRWCPDFESGSSLPIFNYWPGKYSNGTPTANLNAFLNFYTDTDRHMFRVDGEVERTYIIWLPPGPVTAGYAVDASWYPPDIIPVTDPKNNFPISANQPEPYRFEMFVNDGEVIKQEPCCGDNDGCTTFWAEMLTWYGGNDYGGFITRFQDGGTTGMGGYLSLCAPGTTPNDHCYNPGALNFTEDQGDGLHRSAAFIRNVGNPDLYYSAAAYDVFDYEIDLE